MNPNRSLAEILPRLVTRPIAGDIPELAVTPGDIKTARLILDFPPEDSAHALTVDMVRAALDAFMVATGQCDEAFDRMEAANLPKGLTPEGERWETLCNHFTDVACEAKDRLMEAILIANGRIEWGGEMKEMGDDWSPVAFELDGAIFTVSRHPDEGQNRPILTVVQAKDITADWKDHG